MDYGYPQYTDPSILKELITQDSVRSEATVLEIFLNAALSPHR